MQIPNAFPHFLDSEALIITAGKTIGKIYRLKDGEITHVQTLEKPLESFSDNEGFFFSGIAGSGGAPKDRTDEDEYTQQLRKNIGSELNALIAEESAKVLYVFEPEHLKGRIVAELQQHPSLTVHTVDYANVVEESPLELLKRIDTYAQAQTPSSDIDFEHDLKRYS